MASSKRKAKLELSFKAADGEKKRKRVPIGGIFEGRFQGSYDVSLSLPADGGEGWDKIVAFKTESGKKVDVSECFVNLVVYEPLEERPPYDGPKGEASVFASEFADNF
jgi:hypothetical protein